MADKEFRSDLYYRLNVFPILSPPLRERQDDIPALVHYFTRKFATRMNKQIDTIPADTMAALSRYHWPGNIRELENFIERAVILSRGSSLAVPLAELKPQRSRRAGRQRRTRQLMSTLEEAEREHIHQALQAGQLARRRPVWRGGPARHEAHDAPVQDGEARYRATRRADKLGYEFRRSDSETHATPRSGHRNNPRGAGAGSGTIVAARSVERLRRSPVRAPAAALRS